jgi:hypothetical protein
MKRFTLAEEDEQIRGFENNEGEDINFLGIKICEGKCHKPFRPVYEGQTVCTQCAIAPHRKTILKSIMSDALGPGIKPAQASGYPSMNDLINQKEADMPEEKICVEPDCQKKYVPTGNCQKRCPECQAKKKYKKKNIVKKTMIELKKVNNEGKEIRPKPWDIQTIEWPTLFEVAKRLCEMTGSVTVHQEGIEITFKKINASCEQ